MNDTPNYPPEMQGGSAKDDKGEKDEKKGPSQATTILRLMRERYRPLLGDDGQPYAVAKRGANIALPLRGNGGLRTQAAKMYADETRGTAPSGSALTDALTVFSGLAEQCEPEPIHLRVARLSDGRIVVDQGTADGRCIIIGPDGWRKEKRSPVLFRRTRLSAPMPDPYTSGGFEKFRKLINVDEDDWQVIVGFMVATLFEDIPHPILGLFGLQGTAKSNATRMIINLVSPSAAPTRSSPRDLKTWVTGANAAWMTGLDNMSNIPDWLSDALCRASTGEGMVDRALYTDSDVSVISFRRVVVINGIDTGEMAGDLAERLIRVELNPIRKRRDERALWADFDEARPYALGALLDLTVQVLKVLSDIEVEDAPRMADFARILAAIDQVNEWDTLGHYTAMARETQSDSLSPFGTAFKDFALKWCETNEEWRGTSTELFDKLVPRDQQSKPKPPKEWPKPKTMKGQIKRDMPALATFGIDVDFNQKTADKKRDRLIVITYDPEKATQQHMPSEGRRKQSSGSSGPSETLFDQPELPDNPPDNPLSPDDPDRPVPGHRTTADSSPDDPNGGIVRSSQRADQRFNRPPDDPDDPDNPMRLSSQAVIGEPLPDEPPAWLDELPDAYEDPSCAVCGERMILIEAGQATHPECDPAIAEKAVR